jgi:hypothetical protein
MFARVRAQRERGVPMLKSLSRREAIAAGVAALVCAGTSAALADTADGAATADATAASADSTSASELSQFVSQLSPAASNLAEDELDSVVACYCYNGNTVEVTARGVIDDATNIEQRKNDDGTYSSPSADDILTYVRNQILLQLVDENGIEVSDDEAAEYMESNLGVSDYATLASYYGLDEDKAKSIVKQGAAVYKLRETVTYSVGTAPSAPTAPEDGDNTKANSDYAAYIVELAGDDWNADTKTWADGSAYATALEAYDFNGETANYQMAFAAYSVATQTYSKASSEQYTAWTTYTNQYFCNATLTVLSLKS